MNEENFKKLTPNEKIEDITVYENAMDFVFMNDDLRNIAISGQYGSGKSSVLATYKAKRDNRKFLHVSVAHFNQEKGEDGIDLANVGTQSSILEWKILNQLVHQIDPEKLTLSKFKTKKKYSFWNKRIAIATALFGTLILVGIYIFSYNHIRNFNLTLNQENLNFFTENLSKPETLILAIIMFCLLFMVSLYYLFHLQRNNMLFKKIKVKDNEIEMFESDQDSYFDHYLNEVLYVFNNIEEDSIVFEDIDRFNDSGIFERLHEINRLINLQKENVKIVRFFYLIRDDVFVTKDRTKFFDFIIPIVPVTDSSNAQDILLQFFKKSDMQNEIESRFLQDVSLYLDDMRIIKNIFNEYIIYRSRLGADKKDNNLNHTKLLGMIIYKNLFPRDFSGLQLNHGLVFTLFNKKDILISKEIEKLNNEIDSFSEKINIIRNEVATSGKELEAIFLHLHPQNAYYSPPTIHPSKIEEYNRRKSLIDRGSEIEELNRKILEIRESIAKLKLQPFKRIINKENIESHFSDISYFDAIKNENKFSEVKANEYFDLLKYLIRNGFLDESYADYMSYFYEESMSRIDKKFLRSIADQKQLEWEYRLDDPSKVSENIDQLTIRQQESLNYSLLEYLLNSDFVSRHKELLSNFFSEIKENSNYEFIYQFFNNSKSSRTKMTRYLSETWNDFWNEVYINKKLDEEFIWSLSIQLLINLPLLSKDDLNIENNLSEYISNCDDYLNIGELSKVEETIIINSMKQLGVKFTSIGKANQDLLSRVYNNNLYKLNQLNVNLMIDSFYAENTGNSQEKNYTVIMSEESSHLTKYVKLNKEEYLSNLLAQTSIKLRDDLKWYLDIVNDVDLIETIRIEYINKSDVEIPNIIDVEEMQFWKTLLKRNQVVFNEKNLITYYSHYQDDIQTFADFVNYNDEKLNMSILEEHENYSEFLRFVISNNSINDNQYSQTVNTFQRYYSKFDLLGIDSSKISILLKLNIVRMTEYNLKVVRENYLSNLDEFIMRFFNDYIDILVDNESLVMQEELEKLLLLDLDTTQVTKILDLSEQEISVIDKGFDEKVISLILDKHYDSADLPNLFINYESYNSDIMARIDVLALNHISILKANLEYASKSLLFTILSQLSTDENSEIGLNLFVEAIPYLNSHDISKLFVKYNLVEFIDFFNFEKKPRLVLETSELNESILSALKLSDFIEDFSSAYSGKYFNVRRRKL